MERFVKLVPAFKDYLWGGTRLKEEYGKKTDLDILAESWELSCHKDGECHIFESNQTLSEYIKESGVQVLGKNAEKFNYFPILIKFIDAKNNLSVQVHPSDEYAMRVEGEYGKTEMWYVMDASDNAFLYFGFRNDITKDELRDSIKNNTLTDILNKVSVKKGDVFFIEAGTVHAIGGGCLICEIQQNSNTTYRVYDYDRRDKNGNPRELHIEKAMDVANLKKTVLPEAMPQNILAECKYFKVQKLNVHDFTSIKLDTDSFVSVVVTSGEGQMCICDKLAEVKKGDSFFIPAQDGEASFSGNCEIILTRI